MTIVDAKIKVSFTAEENRAFRIVRDIFEKLEVKDPMAFLTAYLDKDWIYYDDKMAFEFLDNQYDPSEDDT